MHSVQKDDGQQMGKKQRYDRMRPCPKQIDQGDAEQRKVL